MKSKNKKKIVYIILNGEAYGGSEKHVADLINNISDEEYEKNLIYSINNKIVEKINNKNIKKCIAINRSIMNLKDILIAIIKIKPDIIHLHAARAIFMGRIATYIYKFLFKMNVKLVVTSHGLWLPDNKNNFIYKFFMHFMKKNDDITIAVSEKSKKELVEIGYNPKKLVRIYNGIDFKEFDKYRNVKEQLKEVAFVGRFTEQKGIRILLEAIKRDNNSFNFMIYGEGELEKDIEQYINSNKLKNVKLYGYSNNVGEVFNKIDLLLAPSIDEGLPYTLVEAMNCGVPIIATNVGGVSEIVHNNENGLVIESNSVDELVKALHSIKKFDVAKLSKKSILISERFSIINMIDEVEKVYKIVLDQKEKHFE